MFPVNIPNVLTLLRILAVPVLVVALLDETPDGDVIAAAVFALAALTDGLDGYIARRRSEVTTFGKLMDPLADKLLVIAALISLVSLDRLAAWVAMVIIARELAVTGLRSVAAEQGVVIAASWLGKAKTLLAGGGDHLPDRLRPGPGLGRRAALPRGRDDADLGRRLLPRPAPADRRAPGRAGAAARDGGDYEAAVAQGASSHSRVVVWWAVCSPVSSSARISPSMPERSATTEWRWIVSRFSWRARTKPPSRSSG